MQVFDPGLLCSSFLSSQWHCKAYDIISLVDAINPKSNWGSCSVLTAGNHSTLYPKKVNTLSLLQIIPSQVKVTMFDEVMWTWVSYFPVFLGISHCPGKYSYFPVYWQPWVQDESLIVHILTPQHSSSLNHACKCTCRIKSLESFPW